MSSGSFRIPHISELYRVPEQLDNADELIAQIFGPLLDTSVLVANGNHKLQLKHKVNPETLHEINTKLWEHNYYVKLIDGEYYLYLYTDSEKQLYTIAHDIWLNLQKLPKLFVGLIVMAILLGSIVSVVITPWIQNFCRDNYGEAFNCREPPPFILLWGLSIIAISIPCHIIWWLQMAYERQRMQFTHQ